MKKPTGRSGGTSRKNSKASGSTTPPKPDTAELPDTLTDTSEAPKVEVSIHLDSELLDQVKHLTSDPSRVIEVALRRWLRGGSGRDDELTRTWQRNPPVPPRGEWND